MISRTYGVSRRARHPGRENRARRAFAHPLAPVTLGMLLAVLAFGGCLGGCPPANSPAEAMIHPERAPKPGLLRCWSGGEVVFERCVVGERDYFSRGSGFAWGSPDRERIHISGNCVIVEGECPTEVRR